MRRFRPLILALFFFAIAQHSALAAPTEQGERVFIAISDPNIAYILLMIGALGLIIELSSPGVILPGVIGGIALVFGALLLFDAPEPWLRLSWRVIAVTGLCTSAFFILVVNRVLAVHRRPPTTGQEGLLGAEGTAVSAIGPEGKVIIHGEYWDASSSEAIAPGEKIVVDAVQGMLLKVRKSV